MSQIFIKWDAHTHTELCPHGNGDSTALMVEKAIDLGFTRYSITEHAPLPKGFLADEKFQMEFCLSEEELSRYFELCSKLKKKYENKIEIFLGLEIDYIHEYKDYIVDLLDQVNEYLDDSLLSLHFLKGKDGYCPFDYSPEEFQEGLVSYYGSTEAVHRQYWSEIRAMICANLGRHKPTRLSHLGLIYKYYRHFPIHLNNFGRAFLMDIFKEIKARNYTVEYNVAGLNNENWNKPYCTSDMVDLCKELKIPLVYGSDGHNIQNVGKHFSHFQRLFQ